MLHYFFFEPSWCCRLNHRRALLFWRSVPLVPVSEEDVLLEEEVVELQHGTRRQREDAPHTARVEPHAFRDGAQDMLETRTVALVEE